MLMGGLLPLSTGGGRCKRARAENGGERERGKRTLRVFNHYLCREGCRRELFPLQPSALLLHTYLDLGAALSLLLLAAPLPPGISKVVIEEGSVFICSPPLNSKYPTLAGNSHKLPSRSKQSLWSLSPASWLAGCCLTFTITFNTK